MTILEFLIYIVAFAVIAAFLYWLITKFAPPQAQMPVLAVVGLLLLVVFLLQFFPGAANFRIWK